jgi:Ca2+-binding EF-hand superfamily protein
MNKLLLGAVALAVAVPALAQIAPPVGMAPRATVAHTRDQAVAKVRDRFARMDANRDGFVAGEELQSMRGRQKLGERGARNRMATANPGAAFDRLDANRDGAISRDEFGRAREMRSEVRGLRKAGRTRGMGGGMMKLADRDRDGRISLQEATTSALQRFDRVDANRDGRITPDERRQNREQRNRVRASQAG